MSLDPATNSMAVTGGEDDKAFVWRVSDGEVLLECTGEGQNPPSTTLQSTLVFKSTQLLHPSEPRHFKSSVLFLSSCKLIK